DDAGMFENMLFVQCSVGVAVILADDHGKFSAGVAQDRRAADSLHSFEQKCAPGARSIEGLLLCEAVRIPRHIGHSEAGPRRTSPRAVTSGYDPVEPKREWAVLTTRIERLLPRPVCILTPDERKLQLFRGKMHRRNGKLVEIDEIGIPIQGILADE